MHSIPHVIAAACVAAMGLASPALGWSRTPRYPPHLLATTGAHLLAAVRLPAPRHGAVAAVLRESARTGRVEWRHRWHGRGPERSDEVTALAAMPDGDAVAAGSMIDGDQQEDFVVQRLDGARGRLLWRAVVRGHAPNASYEEARDMVIAPNGDVLAVGAVQQTDAAGHYGNFAVVALEGATGVERWRYVVEGSTGAADHVVVDANGDLVVAGDLFDDTGSFARRETVRKLAGATGDVLWVQDGASVALVADMVLDDHGDVLIAGTAYETEPTRSALGIAKLSGAHGGVAWTARESLDDSRWQTARRVLVDGDGNVFAAGMTNDGTGRAGTDDGYVFTVVRLDAATGARLWRYREGGAGASGFARQLALGADDTLIAAGTVSTAATCGDGYVVALDRTSGAPRWSERFDGSFATATCHPDCGERPCPPVDDDTVDALTVDRAGSIFLAGSVLNGTGRRPRSAAFLRRLPGVP